MTTPRVGSRPWRLSQMAPGDRELFEVGDGGSQRLMQQIAADITRLGARGLFSQALLVAVQLNPRALFEIVSVTRLENPNGLS